MIPDFVAKPVPLMVTTVPVGPVVGVSDIDGVTVNFLLAVWEPSVATTVCGAATDAGTVNVAVKPPVELVDMVPGVVVTDAPL